MKTKYVLAVILSPDLQNVWLMRKKRSPKDAAAGMDGKLNFPGGHVEDGETPLDAVRRELLEECGYEGEFSPFCAIDGEYGASRGYRWVGPRENLAKIDTHCLCFWSRAPEGAVPASLTDEEVLSVPLERLRFYPAVDDVNYLALIALGLAKAMEVCPACMDIEGATPFGCVKNPDTCNTAMRMR